MLDEAGLADVQIVASNDLDEDIIAELKAQGAKIDVWGVGTQLITAFDQPSLGGVYKLVAREKNGVLEPVIKISGNPDKISNPGVKEVYRIVSRQSGMAVADYMGLPEEEAEIRLGKSIRLSDPLHPHRSMLVEDYDAIALLHPIYVNGELIYEVPKLDDVRSYHREQLDLFWPEHLRKLNSEMYRVHFSQSILELKTSLLHKYQG
jgi:nicotinate phosphoribosyltransferase